MRRSVNSGLRRNGVAFINPPELAPPPGYAHVADVAGRRLIFIAGQVATDRQGNVVGGDLGTQAEQVFRNLGAALRSVDCTPHDLVKLTVFLRDMTQLPVYRKARDRFLDGATPAITLVEVSRLFDDPLLIEIEAIAAG